MKIIRVEELRGEKQAGREFSGTKEEPKSAKKPHPSPPGNRQIRRSGPSFFRSFVHESRERENRPDEWSKIKHISEEFCAVSAAAASACNIAALSAVALKFKNESEEFFHR